MKAENVNDMPIDIGLIKDRKEKEKAIFQYINPEIEKFRTPDPNLKKVATCCFCCNKQPQPPKICSSFNHKESNNPDFSLKSVVLIYNPFSGNGRGGKNFKIMEKCLNDSKIEIIKIFKTERFQHAKEICIEAQEIDKADAVICTGGDGTLNEIVNGLKLRQQKSNDEHMKLIGYVAGGTANDLGEALYGKDERYNVEKIMNQIIKGKPFGIDMIQNKVFNSKTQNFQIEYSHFCTLWGIGVVSNIRADKMRCLGKARYNIAAFIEILKQKNRQEITLQIDENKPVKLTTNLIFIQNIQFLADSLRSCPLAQLNDGYLDLAILENQQSKGTLDAFDQLKRGGSHIYNDNILYGQFKKLKVTTKEPTLFQFDGENEKIYTTPLECEILQGELKLLL